MYTIFQALESIKEELEGYERELKKMGGYARDFQRRKMLWCFERGVSILKLSKKGEIKPEVFDWFLGRTEKKPYDTQRKTLEKIRKRGTNRGWFDWFKRR